MTRKTAVYDLHLHTGWSYDATASVAAYFKAARRLGVRCIAITDHHLADGLDEVQTEARGYPEIRVIRASEITVQTTYGPIDLLCYGLPDPIPANLEAVFDLYRRWQRDYGSAISEGMRALGFSFTEEQRLDLLATYRPARAIASQGATHVRNNVLRDHFLANGFINGPEQYGHFMQRLGEVAALPPYPAVSDVVPALKDADCMIVIAHPYGYFLGHDLRRMDALREICGLDGIECAHPGVPPEYGKRYSAYCERHGLFPTGGSDCHDESNIDEHFARHDGPAYWLENFLNALDRR